jgi:hypothetical protein
MWDDALNTGLAGPALHTSWLGGQAGAMTFVLVWIAIAWMGPAIASLVIALRKESRERPMRSLSGRPISFEKSILEEKPRRAA